MLVVCLFAALYADKEALYEFIVRHFLASCSKDAVGQETNVTIDIGGEAFRTTGERSWWQRFFRGVQAWWTVLPFQVMGSNDAGLHEAAPLSMLPCHY